MASSTRRDLYLQVSGDIDPLRAAMKAGKSVLNELGTSAIDTVEKVEQAFKELGGQTAGPRDLERSYARAFENIRANAAAVLDAPTPQAAVEVINAGAAREAADAAERRAASLRLVAEAAVRAAAANEGDTEALRVYATASTAAARGAEQYAQSLREQAAVLGAVDAQIDRTTVAQRRQVEATGQQRAGMQQLGFQLNDVAVQAAAGTPPMMIFSMQVSQVTQAVALMNQGGNKFLDFLGGPWGIGIGLAVTVLSPLVAKLLEGNDAVAKGVEELKKDADQTEITRQARERFIRTIDGQIDAQRKLNEELERGLLTEQQVDQKKLDDSRRSLATFERERERARTAAEQARRTALNARDAVLNPKAGTNPESMPGLLATAVNAEAAFKRAADRYNELNQAVIDGRQAIRDAEIPLLEREVAGSLDAATDATDRYTAALGRLRQERSAGLISKEDFKRELAAEESKRDAAVKAAQEAKGGAGRDRSRQEIWEDFKRELGARGVMQASGRTGFRSAADQNQIFRNGESPLDGFNRKSRHQSWQALDPTRASHNEQSAHEAATAAGLRGFRVVTESGGRKHYEWTGAGRRGEADVAGSEAMARRDEGAARKRETEGRKREEAERKRIANEQAYEGLLTRARADQLGLQRERTTNYTVLARLDRESIENERQRLDSAAQAGADQKRWTQAQADALKLLNRQNANMKVDEVNRRELQRLLDQQYETARAQLDGEATILELQADLAGTAAERRRIARRLFAIEEEEARLALKRQIAAEQDPERRRTLEGQLARLPKEYELKERRLDQQQEDPYEAYKRRLEETTGNMDEALAGVKARGLQELEDGLVGVITGTESVAGAFKKMANAIIADLARILVRKLILSAIGGPALGFADGGEVRGFAGGGPVFGPGGPREDKIPAMLSNGEFVINAASTKRYRPLIEAINDNQLPAFADGGLVAPAGFVPRLPSVRAAQEAAYGRRERLEVDVRARVDAGPEFDARMERVAVRTVGAAAEPIMAGAQARTMKQLNRPGLPGGWG